MTVFKKGIFNNSKNRQMTQTRKKAIVALKQTWNIGERQFGRYYKMRKMMFDSVVRGIMYEDGKNNHRWKEYS